MTAGTVDVAGLLALIGSATSPAALTSALTSALLSPAERRLMRRCAAVRRFDRALLDEVLRPDADADAGAVPLDRLTRLPGVREEPGRPGWYAMSPDVRAAHEAAWLGDGSVTDETLGEAAYRALNARLAAWFDALGRDGELEALYHRLVSAFDETKPVVLARFDAAARRFDLAWCEELLRVLDARARFLDTELASFRTEARGLLQARSAVADEYFRTARYLRRAPLLTAFETTLHDPAHWILHLHGAGGRGKTMFLRWLAAHYCLPQGILITRVDFDYLDASEVGLAPRFFFGKLAERLNPQLRGAPFNELLDVVQQQRRAAVEQRALAGSAPNAIGPNAIGPNAIGPNAIALDASGAPVDVDAEKEIIVRFARVLEEHCRGCVALVFDTLEDAHLKHRVNLRQIVRAVERVRELVAERSLRAGRTPPKIVLVLSGRYPLAEQYPDLMRAAAAHVVVQAVEPFDDDEALRYLTENRGLPETPAVAESVRRAGGMPFKLALYADVLQADPHIDPDVIARHVDVDLLYLVERVLKRIPDFPLRWVLRYGVVARRLTRRFLEDVLGPHLRRAMAGDRRYDDPAVDDVHEEGWPALWYERERASRGAALDFDDLWARLRNYASASSWVTDTTGALVIQAVVTHPLRRVLRRHAVYRRIHRDAARVLEAATGDAPAADPERLAEVTYHDFQWRGARAARRWRARLLEHFGDADAMRALASVLLSEDLRESEAGGASEAGSGALVTAAIEAEANFALAQAAVITAARTTGEARQAGFDEARIYVDRFLARQSAAGARVVSLPREAMLRWPLVTDAAQREAAIAQLVEAERGRVSTETRVMLLRNLHSALAYRDPHRAEAYVRKLLAIARRGRRAPDVRYAVDGLAALMVRRGAFAAALRECLTTVAWLDGPAAAAIRGRPAAEARRELRCSASGLERQCGLAARALAHAPRPRSGDTAAGALLRAEDQLERAVIHLASDAPILASDAARAAAATLTQRRRLDERPDAAERAQRLLARCLATEGHAARRLADSTRALQLYKSAQLAAVDANDHGLELQLRLAQGRLHLEDLGDLTQATELLGEHPVSPPSDGLPDTRVEHALLYAALADRQDRGADAAAMVAAASGLVADCQSPAVVRVTVAVEALALSRLDDRARYLAHLRDALAAFDHPAARLAHVRRLHRCAPLADVPSAVADALVELSRLRPLGSERIAPADRLRFALTRVELLRVLGRPDAAVAELRRHRASIRRTPPSIVARDVARACDRLALDPEELLGDDWLDVLADAMSGEPAFVGAVLVEAAERAFRGQSAVRARALAERAAPLLVERGALVGAYEARLLALSASLTRESGHAVEAAELHARSTAIYAQLGDTVRARSGTPLETARRDAWREELAERDMVSLHVDSPERLTLRSWSASRTPPGITPSTIDPELRDVLQRLLTGPLGGSASLPLIERLEDGWPRLGLLLAGAVLPPAMRAAITVRLADGAGALDASIESAHHRIHAIPWELAAIDPVAPRPIVYEPGMRCLWRAVPNAMPKARVAWAQREMSVLLERHTAADGLFGPATQRAIEEAQARLGVPVTGALDAPTRLALREARRARRAAAAGVSTVRPVVVLVRGALSDEIASQRGFESHGIDLADIYERRGFDVRVLSESEPEKLAFMLRREQPRVLHVAAPVAEARSSGELSVRFGRAYGSTHATSEVGPSLLATLLKGMRAPNGPPAVVLDVPRPPSRDEALRQLMLRNVFAAQLHAFAALPMVLATGLGMPDEQRVLSERLVDALMERASPGETARRLRESATLPTWPTSPNRWSPEAVIATACVALFARDPELDPEDESGGLTT